MDVFIQQFINAMSLGVMYALIAVGFTLFFGVIEVVNFAHGEVFMLGAFAACIGSLFFSYFNDSYFWVVNNLMGIKDTKEQIRNWSVTSTIAWGVGLVELLILSIFMH